MNGKILIDFFSTPRFNLVDWREFGALTYFLLSLNLIGHQLAMALRRAYLAMHRCTDAALAQYGVTADQFVLLSALSDGTAMTQQELSARTASDKNTVRAMLLLLEKRGLIARHSHPTDGRARSVALTVAGKRIYRKLWAATESVRIDLEAIVGSQSAPSILELLVKVADDIPSRRT